MCLYTELNFKSQVVSVCTATLNTEIFFTFLTQCIYMLCIYVATNSQFSPMQHSINVIASVYCVVRTAALNRTDYVSSFKG